MLAGVFCFWDLSDDFAGSCGLLRNLLCKPGPEPALMVRKILSRQRCAHRATPPPPNSPLAGTCTSSLRHRNANTSETCGEMNDPTPERTEDDHGVLGALPPKQAQLAHPPGAIWRSDLLRPAHRPSVGNGRRPHCRRQSTVSHDDGISESKGAKGGQPTWGAGATRGALLANSSGS